MALWNRSSSKNKGAAADSEQSQEANQLVSQVLRFGLDGVGPLKSATETGKAALAKYGSESAAIRHVIRDHTVAAGGAGFVTNLGGFFTLPVALPANLLGYYTLAARMVGAIATIRGYDVSQQSTRTAIMVILAGAKGDEVLRSIAGGKYTMTNVLGGVLPSSAMMLLNKGIGFQVLRQLTKGIAGRLGKSVPVVGGAFGGALDAWTITRIGSHAKKMLDRKH